MSFDDPSESVLTVFQAAPLAYEDYAGNANRLQVLDFDTESTILKETLEETDIRLEFETATSKNLGNFLSQGNKLMHFSGHGHPKYLFIENEYGGGQTLLVNEDLKAWIRAGGDNLKFVFVAACHSRSAGEAFVDAGVEHVVCAEKNDQMLSDTAAMIFSRDFYRALANGRSVQYAFDLAKNGVIHAPELIQTGLNPQVEAQKFVLLPEGREHDLTLFPKKSGKPVVVPPASPRNGAPPTTVPFPPENFIGRELEMYDVFRSMILKKTRLVSVTGQKGIGKASFAKAVGHYMQARKMWGEVLWFPSPQIGGDDDAHSLISKVIGLAEDHKDLSAFQGDKEYQQTKAKIIAELHEKKSVLIIDSTKFSNSTINSVSSFLFDLFERTKHMKVLAILRPGTALDPNHATGFPCSDTTITLQRLDFHSTVYLFGRSCPYASSASWLMDNIIDKYNRYTESTSKILGDGIPAKTIILAKNMKQPEYEKLTRQEIPIEESDFVEILKKTVAYDNNQDVAKTRSTQHSLGNPISFLMPPEGEGSSLSPVRNQKEVQSRFVPLLRKHGKICRKQVTSFIRKARKGEQIVTAIDGVHESQKTVNDDTSYVVCGKAAGEFYVLTEKEFHDSYDESSGKPIPANTKDPQSRRLRQQGFFEYQSKRFVWARTVDEEDMKFFRHGADSPDYAYFVAPWGETMRVEAGDYLVTQYASNGECNEEVYRVERIVFEYSYIDTDEEEAEKKLWIWTAVAIGVAGLAVVVALALSRSRPRR